MEEKLNKLKEMSAEIYDIGYAAAVLGWDQQVNMPPMGAESRGNQLATLQRLVHIKSTSPELGKLIGELSNTADNLDPDSEEARLIKVSKRNYEKAVKVPPEFTAKFVK